MSANAKLPVTTLSTKGQVILPKPLRALHGWKAGTRLVVRDTPEGLLLSEASAFEATRPDDVFGCLARKQKPRTIAQMDAAVLAEARRRARD